MLVRGKYDAAQTTDNNRKHWANADSLAPNAAMSPAVRRIIRARSRYEIANNCYARGIVNTMANYVVGTGPQLQLLTDDSKFNQLIEERYADWCRQVRFCDKLWTMQVAEIGDGEGFGRFVTNPNLLGVKLDLLLLECDQIARDTLEMSGETLGDGVNIDDYGRPVSYNVLKHHPGNMQAMETGTAISVSAKYMIHLFEATRPGQLRGIPRITPALPLFAQLRRYTLASLDAAETAANFSLLLKTDLLGADPEAAEVDAGLSLEIERNSAPFLPEGWEPYQLRAEQPTTTYAEFKHELINEIARCLDMPYNIAAANSSNYNYASGRLDHQSYFRRVDVDRNRLERIACTPSFDAWRDEAVLVSDYIPIRYRAKLAAKQLPHVWRWPGIKHVDPAKEANAQDKKLANAMTTWAREHGEAGNDWEIEIAQRAKELGMTIEQFKTAMRVKMFGNDPLATAESGAAQ